MIDLRIMDNLANDKKPAIFEDLARGISEIDGALDPVTEAKLFRQTHGCIAHGNDSASAAHFLDNVAAIMGLDLLLHRRHHIRCAEVDFLASGGAAGNQIRAHFMVVILSEAKNPAISSAELVYVNIQRAMHCRYACFVLGSEVAGRFARLNIA